MDFCRKHKAVQDFIAELLDKVRQAEHPDVVAVDADHGLREDVKNKNAIHKDLTNKIGTFL